MGTSKDNLMAVVRWGWFGLLVLCVFGYMASGLSNRDREGLSIVEPDAIRDPGESLTIEVASSGLLRWSEEVQPTVEAINHIRADELAKRGMTSAPNANWMTVCRRLSLALVGSGLSLEDIRELEKLPEEVREKAHLRNLLHDSRFHDYWAERWTRFLVGTDEGPFVTYRRRRFAHWLSDELATNRPYDQLVKDLITAEGLWTDQPEVNFLTATLESNDGSPDPVRLAARTSRAFLGLRIDCLQCHNDFLGNVNLGDTQDPREGMQTDFHQLAAFYSSAELNGLQGVRTGETQYKYKYLDATEEVEVPASVPYSPELLPDEGDPRQRLAVWVTHRENRQFSKATVNRIWALMFGTAATESIDNLPLDETLPPMLERLADDFQTHFDLRRLVRTIAQTDAFRVSSEAEFEVTRDHEDANAVFPLVRLRPEQVAGAIIQSSRIKTINRDSSLIEQLQKFGSTNDFLERYGDMGEDEFEEGSITITQRLTMINGKMLGESIAANPFLGASSHINMFSKNPDSAVENAYLCILNRYPSDDEKTHFSQRISNSDQKIKAVEDLFWALLNSTELAWNH